MRSFIFICLPLLFFSLQAQEKEQLIFDAINSANKQQLVQLLSNHSDPNAVADLPGGKKISPLILSIQKRNTEFAQILIQYKASVNYRDGSNKTALMYAAENGNKELVQLLVDSGADLKANDGKGNSVHSCAQKSGNPEVLYIIEKNLQN